MTFSWIVFSQSYNISLNPNLDIYQNIVRGINHGAGAQVKNNTPGGTPIKNVQFNWYISSDSILNNGDKIVESRLVWNDVD